MATHEAIQGHLDDLSINISCWGNSHSVTWRDFQLKTPDHDLDAERAAIVIGGGVPPCVALLQAFGAWKPSPRDPRPFLHLLKPGLLTAQGKADMRQIYGSRAGGLRSLHSRVHKLILETEESSIIEHARQTLLLLGIPRALQIRAALSFVKKEGALESNRALMEFTILVLIDRLLQRNTGTLESLAPRFRLTEDVEVLRDGGFGLPYTWLLDVWGNRVAQIGPWLVLSFKKTATGRAQALLISFEDLALARPTIKSADLTQSNGFWRSAGVLSD